MHACAIEFDEGSFFCKPFALQPFPVFEQARSLFHLKYETASVMHSFSLFLAERARVTALFAELIRLFLIGKTLSSSFHCAQSVCVLFTLQPTLSSNLFMPGISFC